MASRTTISIEHHVDSNKLLSESPPYPSHLGSLAPALHRRAALEWIHQLKIPPLYLAYASR